MKFNKVQGYNHVWLRTGKPFRVARVLPVQLTCKGCLKVEPLGKKGGAGILSFQKCLKIQCWDKLIFGRMVTIECS